VGVRLRRGLYRGSATCGIAGQGPQSGSPGRAGLTALTVIGSKRQRQQRDCGSGESKGYDEPGGRAGHGSIRG
jgi:hypothetical protein